MKNDRLRALVEEVAGKYGLASDDLFRGRSGPSSRVAVLAQREVVRRARHEFLMSEREIYLGLGCANTVVRVALREIPEAAE